MVKASENPYPNVLFDEQASDIATPASDRWVVYTKSTGVFARNAAGTITGPFGTAGGASTFVGAKAYSGATQSISDATSTAVALELEEYDTDAFHDLVTNNSRFTVPSGKAGKYLLTGGVSFAAGASPVNAQVWWVLNGTTDIRGSGQSWLPSASVVFQFTSTAHVLLAVGDYVQLFCYQDSSGSRNIGHASTVFLQSNGAIAYLGA